MPETQGKSAQRKESVWLSTQSQSKLSLGSLGRAFADLIVSEPAGGGLVLTVRGLALANSKKTSAFSSMVEVWRGAKAGVSRSQLVPQVRHGEGAEGQVCWKIISKKDCSENGKSIAKPTNSGSSSSDTPQLASEPKAVPGPCLVSTFGLSENTHCPPVWSGQGGAEC